MSHDPHLATLSSETHQKERLKFLILNKYASAGLLKSGGVNLWMYRHACWSNSLENRAAVDLGRAALSGWRQRTCRVLQMQPMPLRRPFHAPQSRSLRSLSAAGKVSKSRKTSATLLASDASAFIGHVEVTVQASTAMSDFTGICDYNTVQIRPLFWSNNWVILYNWVMVRESISSFMWHVYHWWYVSCLYTVIHGGISEIFFRIPSNLK